MASSGASSSNRGFEENTLAILDSSGIKDARDLHDDRVSFLDAVRSASLLSNSPAAPSRKIYGAVFQILRDSKSLEVAMASYQLLTQLDERYPRVYIAASDKSQRPGMLGKLVVVKEAWSPFIVGSETAHGDGDGTIGNSHDLLDSMAFSDLLEDIAPTVCKSDVQPVIKLVENMLLFQYLVNALQKDFSPRHAIYKETLNWDFVRDSILNMLLGPRKLNFKSLARVCMAIIYERCQNPTKFSLQDLKNADSASTKITQNGDVTLAIAVNELGKQTCISLQKFMILVMELDALRKGADLRGLTSRADGFRNPLLEIILDELTYNKDRISPFLEVFSEPKWKLEIVLQYFSKYLTKPSVRTRRSTNCSDDVTFEGILSLFSTAVSAKNIIKKLTPEVSQLLIAHAFQAYLSLLHGPKDIANSAARTEGSSLSQICNSLLLVFKNFRKIDESLEVTSFEKQALFTAATILSNKP